MTRLVRSLLAGALAGALVLTGLTGPTGLGGLAHAGAAPASAEPSVAPERTVTLVNQDAGGQAAIRFDVAGEAIDAHDGQIQRFGDTYYLYGTTYGCGYEWNTPGAPFCGFVSYSSPDLVHWTPEGPLFDASTEQWQDRCDGSTYGCYRPHVVFNELTQKYVLWINTYDNGVGYRVLTSDRPDGGFVEVAEPDLGAPEGAPRAVNYGDHQVFVDDDGSAYLSFTDWRVGGDIIVEKLDETYTTGSGEWTRVSLRSTEAPTIFEREGTYYLTYSDPNRGYTTTGTGFVTAPSPLGPWSGTSATPAPWTVADGVLEIDGGGIGLSRAGADWVDYTFTATVTPRRADASDYGQVGLVFRAGDGGSYQWLIGNYPHAGATGGNLTKLVPGRPTQPATRLPMDIVTDRRYEVAITVSGTTAETRIDGQLVDTTELPSSAGGRVGFRQNDGDGEKASVDDVLVTAADGTVLLDDDFDAGLAQWDQRGPTITGTNLTTTSCGGQPADVLPLETASGTLYLYQSDVWMNAKPNEALAKHYWQPLTFDDDGAIEPIECGRSYDVTIPVGPAGPVGPVGPAAPLPPEPDVSTGDAGFLTHYDVYGGIHRAQGFTVPETGRLSSVRITSYQTDHPDAPLQLTLHRVGTDGTIGDVVRTTAVDPADLSWAARWVDLDLTEPLDVVAGERFALAIGTDGTRGRYGMAYTDTVPFEGGAAYFSNDDGATWRVEEGRALHLEADVTQPPLRATTAPRITGTARVGSTLRAAVGTWDGAGVTTSLQWLRGGRPVAGATGPSYRLGAPDVGQRVSVRVTASAPGRTTSSATATSAPVAKAVSRTSSRLDRARVKAGRKVTVTAGVTAPGVAVSGRVQVRVDGRVVRTLTLRNGTATTRVKVRRGKHTVVVRYLGSATTAPSAAPARTVRGR